MEIEKKNDRMSDYNKSVELLKKTGEGQEPATKRKL